MNSKVLMYSSGLQPFWHQVHGRQILMRLGGCFKGTMFIMTPMI